MTLTITARRALLAALLALALPLAQAQDKKAEAKADAAPTRVLLTTSEGDITLELDADKAPKSVANFLQYVKAGFYNGTIFHRVIDGFMIQGGGFTPDMKQKTTRPPIPIESQNGLKNVRGSIAMARTADPNSATAQFFINVVDKIRAVPTTTAGMYQNVPSQPVLIRTAKIVK